MNDIENIIEKYKKELMEFAAQNPPVISEAIPVIAEMNKPEPEQITVDEEPIPVAEGGVIGNFFPQYDSYDEFLSLNTERGELKVQVFAANQTFPVSGARVNVFLPLSNNSRVDLFEGLTDINGIVDGIVLPAPLMEYSQSPETANIRPFATYSILVTHPDFANARFLNVPVFSNTKSIQGVELVPLVNTGEVPGENVTSSPEPYLNLRGGNENGNTDNP